ncbi:type II toxin-antitoxin system RelE/ParE family toxin [Rhizobium sp. BK602]|uniref:type II toxin-antitoxin system RelE/ParE family toxin n=1 Tax=Rhizobium sp. BK602 TaxID=2586986 RepID=UPI00160B2AF3|nr:plasmid stabilization system protein ParE [Rhizobium sp. BK602]
MNRYTVQYAPEAFDQLDAIEAYIAEANSPETAERYVDDIVAYCDALATFPERGAMRDDLLPGLRVLGFRRRVAIAFAVDRTNLMVSVIGIYYGGQDYEGYLLGEHDT